MGSTLNDIVVMNVHNHGALFLMGTSTLSSKAFIVGAKFSFDDEGHFLPIQHALAQAKTVGTVRKIIIWLPNNRTRLSLFLRLWLHKKLPAVDTFEIISLNMEDPHMDPGASYVYNIRGELATWDSSYEKTVVSNAEIARFFS